MLNQYIFDRKSIYYFMVTEINFYNDMCKTARANFMVEVGSCCFYILKTKNYFKLLRRSLSMVILS